MNRVLFHFGLALGCALVSGFAQAPGDQALAASTNAVSSALIPPPITGPRSPVEAFRELLAMPPLEQRRALASRPPETRKLIQDKIREYQAMAPQQRAIRLEVTELRWYLRPLMRIASTNRAPRLEAMPADMRKLVEERLRIWDSFPTELQQKLMQNEATAGFISEIALGTRTAATSPNQYRTNIAAWQQIPEEERRQISLAFSNLFGLNPEEQQKVLDHLSPEEHRQIEKTLQVFRELTPVQRGQCIRSFEKFASLSPAERKEFLLNAQRWESMPPADREVFRAVVENAASQPPLPVNEPPMPSKGRPLSSRLSDTAMTNR